MKKLIHGLRLSALAAGLYIASAVGANAQSFVFNNGDIILAFQATGGQGANQNVFFNLGSSTALRDSGGNLGLLGNINADLSAAFGADWFTRDDVWVGAFGNLNFQGGLGAPAPVDGDPTRTIYVSRATSTPGGSNAWSGYVGSQLTTAGSNFSGLENFLPGLAASESGAATLDATQHPTPWNNSWSKWNPTPGTSFNTFGNIQNSFGQSGDSVMLDIQRILATHNGADPDQLILGQGYTISTIVIGLDGSISAIPEPSTWLLMGLGFAMALFQMRRRRTLKA